VGLCCDRVLAGDWAAAERLAAEGLRLGEANGTRLYDWQYKYYRAWMAALQGRAGDAIELCGEIERWGVPRKAAIAVTSGHHVRALVRLGRGDFEDAYQHLVAISPAGVLAPWVPHALWVALDTVECAGRTGRHPKPPRMLRRCAQRDWPPSRANGSCRGRRRSHGRTRRRGDRALRERLGHPRSREWPFERARVELLCGEHFRRIRPPRNARPALTSAVEAFERLGAAPWRARALSGLRATGLQLCAAARRPHPRVSAGRVG
jgi:hypothetical protein